jgi:hypothetical protein
MVMIRSVISLLLTCSFTLAAKYQAYPISQMDPATYSPYVKGQPVLLETIRRQIDNGEHMFDEDNNIMYGPMFKCLESNAPFSLSYMKDSNVKCTIKFEDELYHLFQLYLHKDVPFTCRFELRPNSGIYLPIDFSFRGNVLESHFDIDPNVNMLMIANEENEIVAGTAFSSSTNTTKVIIGQNVELNFNIKWATADKDILNLEENIGAYWIDGTNTLINWIYAAAGLVAGMVLTFALSYKRISKKVQANTWNKVE